MHCHGGVLDSWGAVLPGFVGGKRLSGLLSWGAHGSSAPVAGL